MISALFFPRSRWHIIFLLPISGYICYGGWKEPLVESSQRSQNTFSSKVQALQSLSTGHYSGRTAAADEVGGHYVVISAAETPHKRFCVRLIMDHDNSNVSLWANSQDCPRDRNEGQLWSFNLTRTSKLFCGSPSRPPLIYPLYYDCRWMCPSTGNCQPRLQLVQNEPGFPTDATTAFHLIAYFAAKESLKREREANWKPSSRSPQPNLTHLRTNFHASRITHLQQQLSRGFEGQNSFLHKKPSFSFS